MSSKSIFIILTYTNVGAFFETQCIIQSHTVVNTWRWTRSLLLNVIAYALLCGIRKHH